MVMSYKVSPGNPTWDLYEVANTLSYFSSPKKHILEYTATDILARAIAAHKEPFNQARQAACIVDMIPHSSCSKRRIVFPTHGQENGCTEAPHA